MENEQSYMARRDKIIDGSMNMGPGLEGLLEVGLRLVMDMKAKM